MRSTWTTGQSTGRRIGRDFQSFWLLGLAGLLLFGAIGARLTWMQLIQGQRNRELADENRIHLIARNPERGRILDRKGRVLASTRLSYSLFVWPRAVRDTRWPASRDRLAQLLGVSPASLDRQLTQSNLEAGYRVRIAANLQPKQLIAFEEARRSLYGVELDYDTLRNYPYGPLAAHLLGYTGEISEERLAKLRAQGYRPGDIVGRSGLEALYERHLRGEWGGQQVEVDALGHAIRVLGQKNARPGRDLKLTIDLDLQRVAEQAIGNTTGGIIALDPRDGAILAMVSRPAFDPNWFSAGVSASVWKQLQQLQDPFLNRSLQGFLPASTFKIITTAAGIESGKFSPDSVLTTASALSFGGTTFNEHGGHSYGTIGFPTALAVSSNTFFYQVGNRVGPEQLSRTAHRFGFGEPTGFELADEESPGLVGDPAWKKKVYGEPWWLGDTISMAIGQGPLLVTPIQLARMYAAIANGGYLVTPHVVADRDLKPKPMGLKPETLATIKKGLRQVVTDGTAGILNDPNLPPVAGKTGTAEDPPRPDHTWFGGFAPLNQPRIVIVAFAQNSGGFGGTVSAPMVHKMLLYYFGKNQPKLEPSV